MSRQPLLRRKQLPRWTCSLYAGNRHPATRGIASDAFTCARPLNIPLCATIASSGLSTTTILSVGSMAATTVQTELWTSFADGLRWTKECGRAVMIQYLRHEAFLRQFAGCCGRQGAQGLSGFADIKQGERKFDVTSVSKVHYCVQPL